MTLRSLLRLESGGSRSTRFLLRRAGLNNRAAAALLRRINQLEWLATRKTKVPPGTVLTFKGRISSRQIFEVRE